jgi:hypothetical protein
MFWVQWPVGGPLGVVSLYGASSFEARIDSDSNSGERQWSGVGCSLEIPLLLPQQSNTIVRFCTGDVGLQSACMHFSCPPLHSACCCCAGAQDDGRWPCKQ